MQAFTLSQKSDGWHITNGRVDFGPYSTHEKASDSAAELTRQFLRRTAGQFGVIALEKKVARG